MAVTVLPGALSLHIPHEAATTFSSFSTSRASLSSLESVVFCCSSSSSNSVVAAAQSENLKKRLGRTRGCYQNAARGHVLFSRVSSSALLPLFVSSSGSLLRQQHKGSSSLLGGRIRPRLQTVKASSLKDSQREVLQEVEGHSSTRRELDDERQQQQSGADGQEREQDGAELSLQEEREEEQEQGRHAITNVRDLGLPAMEDDAVVSVVSQTDQAKETEQEEEEEDEEDMSGAVTGTVAAIVFLLAFVGTIGAAGFFYREQIDEILTQFSDFLEGYGSAGYALFVLGYAGLEVLAIPAVPLTMSAGLLFGSLYGTILVSISGTLAATASFLIARYLARDRIVAMAKNNKKFLAIDKAIGEDSFRVVTLLRLSPLLPFSLGNYLYGLTSVKLLPYILGSWLGMLPGTWAYVSAGAFGRAFIVGASLLHFIDLQRL
jgi:uncharacterized membrane protein YdjX (TVP38/TMEM64 family)